MIFSTSVLIYETIGIVSDQRIINLAVALSRESPHDFTSCEHLSNK